MTSNFWRALFVNLGTRLDFSSAYHPETDGQSEIVNSTVLDLLKCYVSDKQTEWEKYLPLVEFAYNDTIHSSTGKAPFEVIYGKPHLPPILFTKDKIFAADEFVRDIEAAYSQVRRAITNSQEKQKKAADKHRRRLDLQLGQYVLLKFPKARLKKQRQAKGKVVKLLTRYYGPFKIIDKINDVTFKLDLPSTWNIHNAFHISLLRIYQGNLPPELPSSELPEVEDQEEILVPEQIIYHQDRTLKSGSVHRKAVHWVRYSPSDKLHVLSGSDDRTVRWWDVVTESEVLKLEGHADYVRSGSANPCSGDVWATGSYDHTVNLWDLRTSNVVLKLQHGKPLEDVLFFPSGGLLATAGGNAVKIWDILGGGRLLHSLGCHQKTVTSLCITPPIRVNSNDLVASGCLLTGSLDGHVKVFDINEFKVIHASKYDSPIMSMDLSQTMFTMAVGTSEGKLFIRQKKKVAAAEGLDRKVTSSVIYEEPKFETVLRPSNYRYFLRGRTEKAAEEDFYVARQQRLRLAEHDRYLRKFQYKDALVSSLKTFDPTVVLAVMEELIRRQGLISAISNLDSSSLELLIMFLKRNVTLPKYSRKLVPFAHKVLDKCAGNIGLSPAILHQVATLRAVVADEVDLQESLQLLQGLIQPLIQVAE
ncbi:hypothetical protein L7F22_051482 [Adiantum nelumboides]|nr:hypothetical protein [Adiantum nelumboides]